MTTLTADPRTATYEDVELLIYKTANRFARQYGKDVDECISIANESYLDAYADHDPRKGKFSTCVVTYAWNAMRNYYRSERRHDREQATDDLSGYGVEDGPVVDLDELSEDARHAAMLALDPPAELASQAKAKGGHCHNWRSTIREYLAGLGWAAARIAESFEEIRTVLSR